MRGVLAQAGRDGAAVVIDIGLADIDRPLVGLGVVLTGQRLPKDADLGEALVAQFLGDLVGVVTLGEDQQVLAHAATV